MEVAVEAENAVVVSPSYRVSMAITLDGTIHTTDMYVVSPLKIVETK